MEEKDYIFYVGNTPGTDNVINYHKKDLKRNVRIETSSNAVFAGPFTSFSNINNRIRGNSCNSMSKIEVNTIDVQCGSTLTLGSSGKTVAIACGASTTGMGSSGTVDWCTTAKTGPFTS